MSYEEAEQLTPGTRLHTVGVGRSSPNPMMIKAHQEGIPIIFHALNAHGYIIASIEGKSQRWTYDTRDVKLLMNEDEAFLDSLFG